MKRSVLLLLATIGLFVACDNTLDITADYEDTTVIYGLLDPTDTVNYVRVGKAFLGEGNALVYAQEFDSLYYGPNLAVTLVEVETGNIINLERIEDSDKPDGIFSSPNQVYYKFNDQLNPDYTYRLTVIKQDESEPVTAETPIVDNFTIDNPRPNSLISMLNPNFPYSIQWTSSRDSRIFEVKIRVNYLETDRNNLADSVMKSVVWDFGSKVARDADGGQDLEVPILFPAFFEFMANNVEEDPNVNRHFRGMDFLFAAAGDVYYTYDQVNGSGGFIQEPPLFTNVENGVGILDSRYNKSISGLDMTRQMYDSLACGSITRDLRFAYYETVPATNQVDTFYCN